MERHDMVSAPRRPSSARRRASRWLLALWSWLTWLAQFAFIAGVAAALYLAVRRAESIDEGLKALKGRMQVAVERLPKPPATTSTPNAETDADAERKRLAVETKALKAEQKILSDRKTELESVRNSISKLMVDHKKELQDLATARSGETTKLLAHIERLAAPPQVETRQREPVALAVVVLNTTDSNFATGFKSLLSKVVGPALLSQEPVAQQSGSRMLVFLASGSEMMNYGPAAAKETIVPTRQTDDRFHPDAAKKISNTMAQAKLPRRHLIIVASPNTDVTDVDKEVDLFKDQGLNIDVLLVKLRAVNEKREMVWAEFCRRHGGMLATVGDCKDPANELNQLEQQSVATLQRMILTALTPPIP